MNRLKLRIEDCRIAVQMRERITREEMMGKSREWRIAHPRQVAMALARELTGASYPKIARHFGGLDHTTVLHSIRAVRARCEASEAYRQKVEDIALTLAVYRAQIEQANWKQDRPSIRPLEQTGRRA